MHAADTFNRTTSNGWGNADTGGAYTRAGGVNGDYATSAANGGTMLDTAGGNRQMTLTAVNARDVECLIRCRVPTAPAGTGTGIFQYLYVRSDASNEYRFKWIWFINLDFRISLSRRSSGGAETQISAGTVAPSAGGPTTYTAGQWIWARCICRDNGSGTAQLRMRVWLDGNAEPNGWDIDTTDATAANQISGDVSLFTFISSGVTNGPLTAAFDELQVFDPAGHDPFGQAGFFGG